MTAAVSTPTRPNKTTSGFGLEGMRDRADMVGGRLAIDTQPGEGTTVCLELPGEKGNIPE